MSDNRIKNVNKKAGGGAGPRPIGPQEIVKAVVEKSLIVRKVPEDAGPQYAGQYELLVVGFFKDPKTDEERVGGGITLHTGTLEECKAMLTPSITVLTMFGAEIMNQTMDLFNRQIGTRKMIDDVAEKTILNPSGFAARCESCGKLKPCGCMSAKQ